MTPSDGGTTLLVSDLHSHYHVIDAHITHARQTLGRSVDQVRVLGDFGLFGPNLHDFFRRDGRCFALPVAFIEGNHEDFKNFDNLVRDYADVVTYLPRNSVHQFGAERWLCIGGAQYMDAWSTPPGCQITGRDITRCLENPSGSIDIVISHDCPTNIGVTSEAEFGHLGQPGIAGLARVARGSAPELAGIRAARQHGRAGSCGASGRPSPAALVLAVDRIEIRARSKDRTLSSTGRIPT